MTERYSIFPTATFLTIEAMNDLMPSAELSALITQLKGRELYACRYHN